MSRQFGFETYKPLPWYQGVIPVLDFETTGVNPTIDRAVQVALLLVLPNGEVLEQSFATLIHPGEEALASMPEEAIAVHKITRELVTEHGKPSVQVFPALHKMIRALYQEDFPIVIYNAPFDWTLFEAECCRLGLPLFERPTLIDPLLLDYHYDKYRAGSRKLVAMAEHYGVFKDGAHNAIVDCAMTAGVLRSQVRKFPVLKEYTLNQLDDLQKMWFTRWAEDRNAYWASKGDTRQVNNFWPARGGTPNGQKC